MSLLRIKNLSVAYGIHRLLDEANLVIEPGERIGLLGRNGEGKSTLLNIIGSTIPYDEGEIQGLSAIKVSKLDQAPDDTGDKHVFDIVATGFGDIGETLANYHTLSNHIETDAQLAELGNLQTKIDAENAWPLLNNIEKTISKLQLNADVRVNSLSGGWQRRVALAQALVSDPDLLLLDEPTNHFDLNSIAWLEKQLLQFKGTLFFVTHDRTFLNKIATRIVDLDRGKLQSWPGSYADYVRRKAADIEQETRQNALFDKKLAQEEKWIRQGIKARRTRNEGRVRALKKMRSERSERRQQQGKVKLNITDKSQSGKQVIKARSLCFSYPDKTIVDKFSTNISRQDRIGIIGPNGSGKTTLINLLLDKLTPNSGTVKLGMNIKVAYFDQLRTKLDPEQTIAQFIGEGRDQIEIDGKSRHIISYLGDFLFTPARARSPIKALSGGERARVLLAHLFSKPVNFLVLDEPTNDLDIETLELLEELLLNFKGTLLLVSHDRTFMDNVITSSMVLGSNGKIQEYIGGYSDAMRQQSSLAARTNNEAEKPQTKPATIRQSAQKKTKLNYKEQRELDALPEKIDVLELKQATLSQTLSEAGIYQSEPDKARQLNQNLNQIDQELSILMKRWAKLEG